MNKMGYNIANLFVIPYCLVPFGGLSEIDVKPGETVIVAPATGRYGGAAVAVALAMGATVIAVGRNEKSLHQLSTIHAVSKRLRTVIMSGNEEADVEALKLAIGNPAGADACIDLSPPAAGSSVLATSIAALRPSGRCAIMGGTPASLSIPYLRIMFNSIRLQGQFMYRREHII